MTKSLFLTGASGYIGGSFLHELLSNPNTKNTYKVTALVRSESSAAKVRSLGVSVIVGGYEREDILVNAGKEFDVIIHTGESADNVPSSRAFLKGISQRPPSAPPSIYIHTSGTGVISDSAHGDFENPFIYDDADPSAIDSLDPSQPHREVDIFVRDQCRQFGKDEKCKGVTIIPPNVYGIGTGPVNIISQQTPALIRFGIKHRFCPKVGAGINWWNNVHIKDLARAYVVLLNELEKPSSKPGWNGYWFAETEQHQWKDIYQTLGRVLHSKSLIESPIPESPATRLGKESDYEAITVGMGQIYDSWGSNSRSRASRLRALGWKGVEKDNVLESVESEVEHIIRHES